MNLSLSAANQMRLHGPARKPCFDERAHRGDHRDDHLDRPEPLGQYADCSPERLHQQADLGRPAPGQHDEDGLGWIERKPRRKLAGVEASDPAEPLDHRMADIGAWRSAQPAMRIRLEWQDGHEVIDIGPHLLRPTRPPGPDARRDIVDDRNLRFALADALGNRMGEFGTVDDDDAVRVGLKPRSDGLINSANQRRQARQNGKRAHHGDIGERKDRTQAFGLHRLAADAGEHDRPFGSRLERGHQLAAKEIPGVLARDNENAARFRFQDALLRR